MAEDNQVSPRSGGGTALVIAHEADGPGGQVAMRLVERGYDIDTHVVTADDDAPNDADDFPDFADYDIVVLMGSIRSLTRKGEIDTWIDDELDRIRDAQAAGQPMLGVCFGAQLVAEALGGSVETSPETEIGWYEIEPVEGQDNPVGAGPWMQWHHDRFEVPPGATLLARTDSAPQLFTIGRTAATQFHPEVDVAHIEGWLVGAPDEYLAEHGVDRATVLAEVRANEARNIEQCHALVDWFLDEVASV